MKKSFRLFNRGVTDTKENTDKTVKLLSPYIKYIDEIALFDFGSHHGFWSSETTKKRVKQLKYAIGEFKKIGVCSVGINVLCTIGHLDEGWDFLDKPDIGTVMGKNGEYSKSCLCINAPGYSEYITERYKIISSAEPDFIWIDDDFRYTNHKFPDVCYCPHCISQYNSIRGTSYTRDELVALTETDKTEKKLWTDFRIKRLEELASKIKEAIYEVNADIEVGLMTGPSSERPWAESMGCKKLRPGAGFYDDYIPSEVFKKSLAIGIINQKFEGIADEVQYEFENFPYQEQDKSDTIRRLECALAVCFGCNGIAFNALGGQNDVGIMRVIASETAYWDKLTLLCKGKKPAGVFCSSGSPFNSIDLTFDLARIGIPVCLSEGDASVKIYTGDCISEKTDEEILTLLAGNVFFDATAFEEIQRRGFAKYCGCHTGRYFDNGMTERISECEINGNGKGFLVNAYMNFWRETPKICELIPGDNTYVLSNLETITGITGKPCMTAYENELGGRVVVSSYFFVTHSRYIKKREQLINVFGWLSRDTMPITVNTPSRVVPVLLRDDREKVAVLANLGFDCVPSLSVTISGAAGKSAYVLENDRETSLGTIGSDSTIVLKNLAPWHEMILLFGK